jgi:ribosome-associated protein
MTETAEKKDVQKLQRVMVDALEDVKAQDISVFNTEHLSSLFERVIIASGTSNRQTKALAANVRDQVRKHGFAKPRIEGEENGEWIIVDCGAAVAHIMQPSIRQYYHLEEIWGDKPVRLKFGAPRPVVAKAEEPRAKAAPKKSSKTAAAPEVIAKKVAAKKTAANNAARRFTSTQRAQKVTQYLEKEKPKAAPSMAKGAVVKRLSATAGKTAPPATVKAAAKAAPKASRPTPAKAAPKSAPKSTAKSTVKTAAKSSSQASSKSPAKTVTQRKPKATLARPRAS